MRPRAYFQTFFLELFELFELLCMWAGLKHFYSHFRSGFTIIYGEKYAFLSLFTKTLRTDKPTDWRTDTASYRDARTHLKITSYSHQIQFPHSFTPSFQMWTIFAWECLFDGVCLQGLSTEIRSLASLFVDGDVEKLSLLLILGDLFVQVRHYHLPPSSSSHF